MKRLILSSLMAIIFGTAFATTAQAKRPPSGEANPSNLGNRTVDTSQIINPHPRR